MASNNLNKWLLDHIGIPIVSLCLLLFGILRYLLKIFLAIPQANKTTLVILPELLSALIAVILGMVAYLMFLKMKVKASIKKEDYIFVGDPGYYEHKKTKDKFCSKCFHDNKLCQLSDYYKDGWVCRNCKEKYIGPRSQSAGFHTDEETFIDDRYKD